MKKTEKRDNRYSLLIEKNGSLCYNNREEGDTVKLLLSGYGEQDSLRLYDTNGKTLWSDTVLSPSFFVTYDSFLFVCSETDDGAAVLSYVKDNDGYRLVSHVPVFGTSLCHLCYVPSQKRLYGACWGSGHLIWLSVEENGTLSSFSALLQTDEQTEKKSRTHFCLVNQAENLLLTCNIGLDRLFLYTLMQDGLSENATIVMPDGCGPRHAVFSSDESKLYVVTENSNEVFLYDTASWTLQQRIGMTTKPMGESFCSAICLTKDNKFLYVANRGADTVSVCCLNEEGQIVSVTEVPLNGRFPRHMVLSQDEQTLLVALQHSDSVCLYPIREDRFPQEKPVQTIEHFGAACLLDVSKEG